MRPALPIKTKKYWFDVILSSSFASKLDQQPTDTVDCVNKRFSHHLIALASIYIFHLRSRFVFNFKIMAFSCRCSVVRSLFSVAIYPKLNELACFSNKNSLFRIDALIKMFTVFVDDQMSCINRNWNVKFMTMTWTLYTNISVRFGQIKFVLFWKLFFGVKMKTKKFFFSFDAAFMTQFYRDTFLICSDASN